MKPSSPKLSVTLLASILFGSTLQADDLICNAGDYRGTFAFYTLGSFVLLPPRAAALAGPFAQAGTFTADGHGGITIESTASYNGLILPAGGSAQYTVTPECVVDYSLALPPPLGLPGTFRGVLSARNRRVGVVISSPPGTVVVGRHEKLDLRSCTNPDFSGAYQVDWSGGISVPQERAGTFARIGRLVADGKGTFTATTVANYGGRLVNETLRGTYGIGADCTLALSYGIGGETLTLTGALAGRGEYAAVVVTSPGWAVAGTLMKQ